MSDGSSPPLNIGVIGLGHWGPNHVRVFASLPDTCVVGLSDTDEARLSKAARLALGAALYPSAERLLAESDADAIVVCTPTSTHHALVKAALQAGKHVLCEKPLCLTSEEGRELTTLAGKHDRVLMVGHVFLFNPGLMRVREMLQAGELGKPQYIAAVRTNLGPFRSDVNAAWDLASHDIGVFNWLLGAEPEGVVAMGASFLRPATEDVVNITLRYPGNVLGSVLCSWLDPKKVRQLTLVGSKRMVTWDDLNLTSPVAIYEKGAKTDFDAADYGQFLRISMWDGDIRMPKVAQAEPLRLQAEHFVDAINGRTRVVPDGAFGTGVVRVLERVSAALGAGAAVDGMPVTRG